MTFIFEEVTRPDIIRREKITKYTVLGLILALIAGVTLYIIFKNWREEREVRRFLTALEQSDYQSAYRIWKPEPSYAYKDFMRDWGPNGDYGKISSFKMVRSRSHSNGVIVTMMINGREARLWVDRESRSISFAPF